MTTLKLKKISYITAIVYTILIGMGMFTSFYINGISYNNPRMIETLLWFEIVMTIFAVVMGVKFFSSKELGFTKINKKQVLWFLPMAIVALIVIINTTYFLLNNNISSEQWVLFVKIAITTLLVGFSEELVYRGIVFATFIKESKVKALFISAVTFSLLHSVNVFGGLELVGMLLQLVMTFLAGLFFGFVRMKIESIIPIMIFHWIWDFSLIGGQVINIGSVNDTFTSAFVIMEIAFALIYIPYFVYKEKKLSNTK